MPAHQSGVACGRCKARHLKCDEGRPGCVRCSVSNVPCPGYVKETKFLDQGASLRRKFKYEEGPRSRSRKKLKEPAKTPAESAPDVDLNTARTLQLLADSEQVFDDHAVIAASPIGNTGNYFEPGPTVESSLSDPGQFPAQATDQSTGATPNGRADITKEATQVYNTSSLYASVNSVFQAPSSQSSTLNLLAGPVLQENQDESEFEVMFLVRHFAENVGPWMDLYDMGNYFASYVPIRALNSPLLRYSAAAIASKQLGRVNGFKPVNGPCKRQASTEIYPQCERTNWSYIATKHYDKAISFLREALVHVGRRNSSDLQPTDISSSQRDRLMMQEMRHSADADDLLAATSILSEYEFMDASSVEWSRHLSGVKSLLDEASVSVMPQCVKPSRAQIATFWNFARCDYTAAYISCTKTRLDTQDLSLWRSAGLVIDENGLVIPGKAGFSAYVRGENSVREDMMANALIFILSKLMNILACPPDPTQNDLDFWKRLQHELDVWFETLPESFTSRWRLEAVSTSTDPARAHFAEIFYSIALCAVTMQQYHFARILMLLHKPREASTSVRSQLRSYREIPEKIAYHSREICAIALGRPSGYAQIHMVQPLFVAGQCLEDRAERAVILDLLRGIETDMGWATGYRVTELLKEWGWQTDVPTE